MKRVKKLLALTAALVMMSAVSITALADAPVYKIIINNATKGQNYTAYKVFDVTKSGDNYSYTIDSKIGNGTNPFYTVVNNFANTEENGLQLSAIAGSNKYNVIVDGTKFNGTKAAALAKVLNESEEKPTPAATIKAEATEIELNVTSGGAGYYLVDSGLGALCALGTATDTVTIQEKNSKPSITKKVQEDSKATTESGGWEESATADIGQTVKFKLTVNTGSNTNAPDENGAKSLGVDNDYVITDTLPKGMSYTGNTCNGNVSNTGENTNATVEISVNNSAWNIGEDFTVSYSEGENNVLIITLKKAKLATLAQNTNIVITYGAKLNPSATVGNEGNENIAKLKYGTFETEEDKAVVYTYQINVFKYFVDENTKNQTPLKGASFTLSDAQKKGLHLNQSTESQMYRYESDAGSVTTITTGDTGRFTITGLDAGTYYLTETKAPDGYTRLTDAIEVIIAEDGTVTYKVSGGSADDTASEFVSVNEVKEILVENKAGSLLPSTGGMGTTIFYVIGGILVVGAGVLLITKRRMDDNK